jgi:AcrR family transcriptional regulator
MENKVTGSKPRKRRKKKELEEIIWAAFERLVIADGFNGVTLVKLAREAKVEPPVIYKRFKNTDDLFEQYAGRYDFWLNESALISSGLSPAENFSKVLVDLIENLYSNEIMQRVLLWVLNDTSKASRRVAMNKEFENRSLMEYLSNGTKNSGLHANIINAIMLAGIYYLILHKKIAPVNTVDFDKEESKEQMKQAIREMINKIYSD